MSGAGRVPGASRRVVRGAGTGAAAVTGLVADGRDAGDGRPEDDDVGPRGGAAARPDDDFLREKPPHWG